MEVNLRKALLDYAKHPFVPVNLQIRMQPSLHQHTCAAQLYGLTNLVVNRFKVEDVPFFRCGTFQGPVEGTECTVLGTEICVVNVPVDDVGHYTFRVPFAADGVRFHANSN